MTCQSGAITPKVGGVLTPQIHSRKAISNHQQAIRSVVLHKVSGVIDIAEA